MLDEYIIFVYCRTSNPNQIDLLGGIYKKSNSIKYANNAAKSYLYNIVLHIRSLLSCNFTYRVIDFFFFSYTYYTRQVSKYYYVI